MKAKKFETLKEARVYLKENNSYDNLRIYNVKKGRRKRYKYIVCTYLQWLNELY